ncbi:nucleotidyltransferase family protein [Demequina zhanjiangensis]|uniref:nucleotidyltransferase family protein n=1 Tax=Demequina zhanjiangensis TaxID=3051659 RepID=UPI00345E602D
MLGCSLSPDPRGVGFVPSMDSSAQMGVQESVDLLHGVVAELGRALSVRVLVIKGPTLARQGLRARRWSTDVDVLVEPNRLPDLLAGLAACGFETQSSGTVWELLSSHAVQVRHELFSAPVDVHFALPGLLGEPAKVFELLWEDSVQEVFAGCSVSVPSTVDHALVAVVAELRTPQSRADLTDKTEELARNLVQVAGDEGVSVLATRAESLGCRWSAHPLLRSVLGVRRKRDSGVPLRAIVAWQFRRCLGGNFTGAAGEALMSGRVGQPWRHALRALWPSEADLLSLGDVAGTDALAMIRYRLRRITRILPTPGRSSGEHSRGR